MRMSRMRRRPQFVIDTSDLSREREVEVCRYVLGLVAHDADTFETDLPLANASRWPESVRAAATRLARHATGRRRESDHYQRTGSVTAPDLADWEAFICVAPYAFAAAVWGVDGARVDLSDEGTSLVAHLGPTERAALDRFEPLVRIMPASQWRKRKLVPPST